MSRETYQQRMGRCHTFNDPDKKILFDLGLEILTEIQHMHNSIVHMMDRASTQDSGGYEIPPMQDPNNPYRTLG